MNTDQNISNSGFEHLCTTNHSGTINHSGSEHLCTTKHSGTINHSCSTCGIQLEYFRIVFSETEKYCRVCGDIFVSPGFYNDDIKDCHKCNKPIDKSDPSFNEKYDKHNNYYCDDCYEGEDDDYEWCSNCNEIVSYPNVYKYDTNNYCEPCYKYIKSDEAENPAHRAKLFRIEYNKLYEDCDVNDFTTKNADNQVVCATEVFHYVKSGAESITSRVKYIMVPELTEECKNKMHRLNAQIVPGKIKCLVYNESDNIYAIHKIIKEYESSLCKSQ